MADLVLIDGDQAIFLPAFGAAAVVVAPGTLISSGGATIEGTNICVDGDEASVEVEGCAYTNAAIGAVIPGAVTLTISALNSDQVATKATDNGTAVMLKGTSFTANAEVTTPAKTPNPGGNPIDDTITDYEGSGSFTTSNSKVTAT